jgi:hypothetical protein
MSDVSGDIVPKQDAENRWRSHGAEIAQDGVMSRCFCGRSAGLTLVLILEAGRRATAQPTDQGLRLEALSFSQTYLSQGVPSGITTYNDVFLGSGMSVKGAATIKWTRIRPKSFWLVRALPSYGSVLREATAGTWDQAFSFSYSRVLGTKWTLNWTGAAQIMSFDEALFAESTLTQVASNPINFQNLTGAIFQGKSPDPELNSVAQNVFHPDRGLQNFLLGRRTANAGLSGTLTFAYSPRLLVSVQAGNTLARHLRQSSDPAGVLFPKSNSAAVGIGTTYLLSPRTQVGVSANVSRSELGSQVITTSSLSGTLNRTMSRRWFVHASLGLGSETYGRERHLNNRYSLGLGYKTFSHTALISFDRGFDDPYDLANAALKHSRTLTGSWHYARPGSSWWTTTAASQLIAIYRGVPGTDTWEISQAVGRRISPHYSVVVQFATGRVGAKRYIQDGRQYQLEQTGIRASFIWSPQIRTPVD